MYVLSKSKVNKIRELRAKGRTLAQISEATGSAMETVRKYLNGHGEEKRPKPARWYKMNKETPKINNISIDPLLFKRITDPENTTEYWKKRCERMERYIIETTLTKGGF